MIPCSGTCWYIDGGGSMSAFYPNPQYRIAHVALTVDGVN